MLDTFFIAAAPGTTWALDIDALDRHLQDRFQTQVRSWIKYAPVTREDYLSFDVDLHGSMRSGAYYSGRNLILNDGDAHDWALTIAWFLGLLPTGAQAVAMRESNPEFVAPLPAESSATQILEILENLAPE